MGLNTVADIIRRHSRFLITTHVNPEGDAVGSELAMAGMLARLKKEYRIVNSDAVPRPLDFLPGAGQIAHKIDRAFRPEIILVLDCPVLERAGRLGRELPKGLPLVNIDHHISNTYFGDINWVDAKASSVGEMMYNLAKRLRVKPNRDIAINLYTALVTDTGDFRYSNTTGRVHRMAAELLTHGFSPLAISQNIYERNTLSNIHLLAESLKTIKLHHGGSTAVMQIKRAMLRRVRGPASTENFINFARSLDGVKIAILLRELKNRRVNVGLRSKGELDVNTLAAQFGGGGHPKAAGCIIKGTMKEAENKILSCVKEYY